MIRTDKRDTPRGGAAFPPRPEDRGLHATTLMTEIDLSRAEWHKSSYSGQSGNCVGVARNLPGLVAVRDSKEPDGTKLAVSKETWQVFIRSVCA
jgi:Domain of unknown function (DUF397)